MLKSILKLKGVQELNKTEQKSITGGNRCYLRCRLISPGEWCRYRCAV